MNSRQAPRRSSRRTIRLAAIETLEIRTLLAWGLDPTFGGGDGVAESYTAVDDGSAYGIQIDVAPDGDIVAAGGDNNFARHNPDGSPDTTFGGIGGPGVYSGVFRYVFGMDVQADNRIVLVGGIGGAVPGGFRVARYNADASEDTTFAGDGVAEVPFDGAPAVAHEVVVQPDGRILAVGIVDLPDGSSGIAIARLLPNGTPDTTFGGGDGWLIDDTPAVDEFADDVALAPGGKFVVLAQSEADGVQLLRYNADGSRDLTFGGGDGLVSDTVTVDNDLSTNVAVQPDGRVLVSVVSLGAAGTRGHVIRFNADGSRDLSFGGGDAIASGFFETAGVTGTYAHDVLVDPASGKIYVAGQQELNDGATSFDGIARLNPDGSLDETFSAGGDIVGSFGTRSSGRSLALQPDGRVLLGGEYEGDFARIARFAPLSTQTPFKPHVAGQMIQAEDYDTGGEGVAYHDLDPQNRGNVYRTAEGVDVGPVPGGHAVGWTRAGEWIEYTVNVPSAGTFKLDASVAQVAAGGIIDVRVDGQLVGSITVPNTGSWTNFVTLSTGNFAVGQGRHVVRLDLRQAATNGDVADVDWIRLTPVVQAQQPFNGTPWTPGQQIEAENYDTGGEGIAYHDVDAQNRGGVYRTSEGVDVGAVNNGLAVGWTKAGEWLEYTVNVPSAGNFRLDASVAQVSAGGVIDVRVDGVLVGTLSVPNTGSWTTFRTISTTDFAVAPGTHVVRLDLRQPAGNGDVADVDWLRLTPTGTPPPTGQTPFLGTPFNTGQTIQAEDFDNGGQNVAYHDVDPANRGGVYRTNEAVDIAAIPGGFSVGWTKPGEWLEYTLNAAATGNYRLELRAANVSAGGIVDVRIDGQIVGSIAVPNTGSWTNFATLSTGNFALTSGQHIVRLELRQASSNGDVADLDWLRVVPA